MVGLYLNPPDKAVVLCVDEKSQIQALQRTQPGLPMKKGRCGTMTHDYKRHGTTTLFAALNLLDGCVIGECMPRHRHQEFLRFLRRLDREFPEEPPPPSGPGQLRDPHRAQRAGMAGQHPRFTLHFIPTVRRGPGGACGTARQLRERPPPLSSTWQRHRSYGILPLKRSWTSSLN